MKKAAYYLLVPIFLLLCTLAGNLAAQEHAVRTWSNSTGKFKIEAKFVSLENGEVTLLRTDGKTLKLGLDKLSQADQDHVKELTAGEENPFEAGVVEGKASMGPDNAPTKESDKPSSAKQIAPLKTTLPAVEPSTRPEVIKVAGQDVWNMRWQPEPHLPAPKRPRLTFPEGVKGFFMRLEGVQFQPLNQRLVILFTGADKLTPQQLPSLAENPEDQKKAGSGFGLEHSRFVVADLAEGTMYAPSLIKDEYVLFDLHPEGDRVLARLKSASQDELVELQIDERQARVISKISPFAQGVSDRNVNWARYVDGGKQVVARNKDSIRFVDLATQAVSSEIVGTNFGIPDLSADGKLLAFTTDKKFVAVDVASGEIVAAKSLPQLSTGVGVKLSPSGKRGLLLTSRSGLILDLTSGNVISEFDVESRHAGSAGRALWASDNHVLLSSENLIQLDRGFVLWNFKNASSTFQVNNTMWLLVAPKPGGKEYSIIPFPQTPSPEMERRAKLALSSTDFFVIQPGKSVRIDASGIGEQDKRAEAVANVTNTLTQMGIRVDETSPVTLELSAFLGETVQIEYRTTSFGRGGGSGTESHSFQNRGTRMILRYKGKEIWKTQAINSAPSIVQSSSGQSIGEALQSYQVYPYHLFKGELFPKTVTIVPFLGTTSL